MHMLKHFSLLTSKMQNTPFLKADFSLSFASKKLITSSELNDVSVS